jgi:glycosyltransferase involved in cell wall biosynthesis
MNLYPAITTITPEERSHFLAVAKTVQTEITVVPNGVGAEAVSGFSDRARGRSVVFWGNLDFPPNWTSVKFFYEQVFLPHLADKDVAFEIIGRGGEAHLAEVFRDPRVIHHGFSKDLYALLSRQGAMVNPMVEGGGLKNKVLEAFACGIPVVSTSLGLDGIAASDGRHCLIANNPEAFGSQVLAVLDSSHDWRKMAAEARSLVLQKYSWTSAGRTLADCMFHVLLNRRPSLLSAGGERPACDHPGNVSGSERST